MTLGLLTSSNKYSSRREGRAIKIRIRAGKTVHTISIVCPSNKNRFVKVLKKSVDIIYPTNVVIKINTTIA